MKLGLAIGYSGATLRIPLDRIRLAERLGYDSVWTAEAYGSDAITPLAWIASHTKSIRLGTSIMQIAGRPPAMAAMQAQTVDALAGGNRVIAGFGVSGPQIVEGWYGQPWGKPYWRMRDYVQIVRKINRRERPVSHDGREIRLPYNDVGSAGMGKPLSSILHTNPDLPIWLGCGGEASVKMAAELCDGLLPHGFVPGRMKQLSVWIEKGFRRAGKSKSWKDFEVQAGGAVVITDDIAGTVQGAKPMVALYVGGMGHPTLNFHKRQMIECGYAETAERIQELYLSGHKEEAAEAVPDEYVDERGLYGTPERIAKRWKAWEDSGITGFTVRTSQDEALQMMSRLANTQPRPTV
jgi:F420-dependent oxidoreductase-like protein